MAGEVIGIYDGNYFSEGPMYAGLAKSFDPTAVFRVEEVDILVATHNLQTTTCRFLIGCNFQPLEFIQKSLK